MMIIFRYLSKEIFVNLFAIILVLLIIFITNQFVHYLKDAASGQITMTSVLKIMSLQIPILLGYLLPLGLYLSILLVFGRFYADHEMTVLFACGMSRAKLLVMTLAIASLVMVVVAVLMLWIEPFVQGLRTQVLDEAVTNASLQKVVPRRFQSIGNGGVFYVQQLSRAHKEMKDVFLAAKEKTTAKTTTKQPWDITVAKMAHEKEISGVPGRFLVFENGYRYLGTPGTKGFQIIHYNQYGVRLEPTSNHVNDWPFNAPTKELWQKRKTNRRAAASIQWRFAMPISVILFTLIAVPLSHIKPRKGKFAKLIPAILIYIIYADLMFLGRAWIEKGTISSALGLWWIHGLALFLAIIFLIHRAGWRRCVDYVLRLKY